MEHLTYCVMCLGTEVKIFHLNSALLKLYKQLIPINDELCTKHMHACYECAYLLHKYGEFKEKCCKAYNILCTISPKPFEVNKDNLKSIDRKQSKLESVLTTCTTSNYYKPNQKNDCCNVDNQLQGGMVKTKSVLNRIQDQCNGNVLNSEKDSELSTADPITFDDLSNQSILNNDEIKTDVKSTFEQDFEDDNCPLNMLKTISSYNSLNISGFYIFNTKEGCDLKTTHVANNIVPLLKLECVDSNNDSDCEVSSKIPVKVERKITRIEKRKLEINKKNTHSKRSKKEKSKNKAFSESMKLGSDIDNKCINQKGSQKNGKTRKVIIDKTTKNYRFSINSSIFKEHMTIVELTPEDAKNELLLRKESRNYKINSHKCDLCYRGFISEATFQTHMKKHSPIYGTLKCDICQLSFAENRCLANHWIVCHTRKFLCKNCPYVCFGANQARAHIQSHIGKKYTCKECGEIFRFPNSLSTHMRLRHSVELVCDFCGSTFASPKGLDCHKRLLHRKEKNEHLGPKCEECNVHFASELAWKRHRVLCSRHDVHEGCGVCGDTFSDASSLRVHLREHGPLPTTWNWRLRTKPPVAAHRTAPQPCDYCDKEFRNQKEYKMHIACDHPQVDAQDSREGFLTTSPMKWVCEVCGKMFKHNSLFISHQRKHTGEKPYSCPDCGKAFKRADAVKAHRPLHTNEYMFKCHLCDKAYGDRGKLNRHIKGHLGIRPYKCPYCDKSFLYQCVANAHTRYVHCKEPYPKRNRSKKNR